MLRVSFTGFGAVVKGVVYCKVSLPSWKRERGRARGREGGRESERARERASEREREREIIIDDAPVTKLSY
jgi:hypothetical protein